MDMKPEQLNESTKGLQEHFADVKPDEQTPVWDKAWQQNCTPWDRSAPSPALVDTLKDKTAILGSPLKQDGGKVGAAKPARKRAFVPGCGRGYDVLLFASFGYDAYGLDAAPTAITASQNLQQEQGEDQSKYPVHDNNIGRGRAKFILGDFFTDEFLSKTQEAGAPDASGQFDVIYDYTFLCALPPHLRPKWAKRMTELLKPTGHLICLEFPLFKDPKLPGPPHGLSSALYERLFAHPGREVSYDDNAKVRESESKDVAEDALERIAHWSPEKTHEVGKGTDRVSIWRSRAG